MTIHMVNPLVFSFCGKKTKRGIQLLIDGAWKQEKARFNDEFLMDKMTQTIRKTQVLQRINDVR